jgi:peptidyl-prolyl cis-trans isomerase D
MLQDIRDKLLGKFAIVLIGVIAVSFVFWGVSSPFISSGYAAKVAGVEISLTQLEQEYRRQLSQYAEQFGELPESFRRPLRERVLDGLIRNTLVDVHVAEEGFRVSDEIVTTTIQRTPDFQVDGVFSKDLYYELLANNGLAPSDYESRQRRAMRQNQLQRSIAATAFVTPAEYRRYLNLLREQRRATLAKFDPASISDEIEISEEQIVTFYDDRPGEFTTPEAADVEYIEIRRDLLGQQVEISEEGLLEYYEESKNRYLQDEQRRARHILIEFGDDEDAAEEQAKALTARIRAGEPFEDLARQHSKDGGTSVQGGDLGLIMQSQMPGELGDAIFSMFEGDIEGPVKTDFGFHVVRLDEILERGPMPLADVRYELENELRDREVDDLYREVERKLSDALFDATELAQMAEAVELEVKSVERFARVGGEPFGTNQAAIDAIFDERILHNGEISEIVELDANRSAIFKVANYYEAKRQPIEDVRELIVGALRTQEARNIVVGKVDQLLAMLADGAAFEESAIPLGAEVTAPALLTRQSESPEQAILLEVFNARKPTAGEPTTGTAITRTGEYVVYSVSEVMPGRPESIPLAERDAGKNALTQQSGVEDFNAFVSQLQQDADVVVSDDALTEQEFF